MVEPLTRTWCASTQHCDPSLAARIYATADCLTKVFKNSFVFGLTEANPGECLFDIILGG